MTVSPSCVVLDYGIGNVFSVVQALKKCGVSPILSRNLRTIRSANHLILPGVGAFGRAADKLRDLELDHEVLDFISRGRPFLGICVGMQLLMDTGFEFGAHEGLAVLPGHVAKLDAVGPTGEKLRIPIIGWNELESPEPGRWCSSIFSAIPEKAAFYFVHSYAVVPKEEKDILAYARVGTGKVVAAVRRENVTGVQFHPERSGSDGLALLESFLLS